MEFESVVHWAGNSNLSNIRHLSKENYAKSQNWEYFMIFNIEKTKNHDSLHMREK